MASTRNMRTPPSWVLRGAQGTPNRREDGFEGSDQCTGDVHGKPFANRVAGLGGWFKIDVEFREDRAFDWTRSVALHIMYWLEEPQVAGIGSKSGAHTTFQCADFSYY
jgi:hypothetical protein